MSRISYRYGNLALFIVPRLSIVALYVCLVSLAGCEQTIEDPAGKAKKAFLMGDFDEGITAISSIPDASVQNKMLLKLLQDESELIRIGGLMIVDSEPVFVEDRYLKKCVSSNNKLESVVAAKILRDRGHSQFSKNIYELISSPDRRIAEFAATNASPDVAVTYYDQLASAADSPWPSVRKLVATLLGSSGDKGHALLLRFLSDASSGVRMNALGSLNDNWHPKDEIAVRRMLDDPDKGVRDNARALLQRYAEVKEQLGTEVR